MHIGTDRAGAGAPDRSSPARSLAAQWPPQRRLPPTIHMVLIRITGRNVGRYGMATPGCALAIEGAGLDDGAGKGLLIGRPFLFREIAERKGAALPLGTFPLLSRPISNARAPQDDGVGVDWPK